VTESAPAPGPGATSAIRVVTGVDRLVRDDERLLFAIGVFDGLHRGHRYLFARLRSAAVARGATPAVITFDAHPDAVILGHAPALLLDPEERLGRLARAGVAVTVVQHFDDALRATTYEAFVAAIRSRVDLAGFLMTPDAAFGHQRRGTPETLAELGREVGFEVVVVPPYELDERPVRSGTIRVDIAAGDLNGARRLLGRPVAAVGEVIGGGGATVGSRGPVSHSHRAAIDPEGVRLRFPIPVALPPQGRYRATVERAWSAEGRLGAPVRRTAEVTAEGVTILGLRWAPDRPRLRVAFSAEASPEQDDDGDPM
jgi:hypothetical protein